MSKLLRTVSNSALAPRPATEVAKADTERELAVPVSEAATEARATPFRYRVRPGARRASRLVPVLAFALLVIVPTLLSAFYYAFVASDQYTTEIQFGVRSADQQRNDATQIFQGMASASQIGLQSNIIVQYIKSREIVDAIAKDFDLRAAFGRDSIDYLSRLDHRAPSEDLVTYWRAKVDPYFELTTGIIRVRVRAFSPEEARAIGVRIVKLSEKLSDDLSRRARGDYVRFAQEQVDEATERLSKVRQSLLEFREQQRTLDPGKEADSARAGIAKLREELARVRTDLIASQVQLGDRSPVIVALRDRVAALEGQIAEAERKLVGDRGQSATTKNLRRFETLESERQIAEKFYEVALQSLQRAQFEANRQAHYLEVFVHPSLAEKSTYPRRDVSVLIVFAAALGIWIFVLMAYYSVREHV